MRCGFSLQHSSKEALPVSTRSSTSPRKAAASEYLSSRSRSSRIDRSGLRRRTREQLVDLALAQAPDQVRELGDQAVEAHARRVRRASELAGDLLPRRLLDHAQEHEAPLRLRQELEREARPGALLRVLGRLRGVLGAALAGPQIEHRISELRLALPVLAPRRAQAVAQVVEHEGAEE